MTGRGFRSIGAALVVGLLVLAACSGSDGGSAPTSTAAEGPRRPTAEEASALASVLVGNAEAGGATFTARAATSGGDFTMGGDVDWVGQRLAADVEAGPVRYRYVTDGQVVEESFPGLDAALATAGHPGAGWFQRPFDATTGAVDIVAEIVVGLAATARDNPVLVRDQARWLEADVVAGVPVDVFEYGARTRLSLDADGTLVRFEADVERLGGTLVVELADLGPRTVTLADPAAAVPVGLVPDVYRQFTGG